MQLNIQVSQEAKDAHDANSDATLVELKAMTPAQAAAYVQTNVTDLASAKTLLKVFAKAIVILARNIK